MKKEQLQQEFESIKEELLTFAYSEQLSPTLPYKTINKRLNHERHKLQLTNSNSPPTLKQLNNSIKRMESSIGKIIHIGSITFKSNFQCGNMSNVKPLTNNTFAIELEAQTNSNRISSWFYFTVQGIKGQAHFIIKGFNKSQSLYNQGMQICYRDTADSKWRRGATKIIYTNSQEEDQQESKSYQLRFSFFFKNNTPFEFAYCFPYGVKKLYHMINEIKHKVSYKVIGKSFNGLDLPLITIGTQGKEIIILTARVHPGETVSSFIIQGFIRELISESEFGKMLREKYLFKIIPMLNPDGVLKGNYRFSGYGCDLNRKWLTCNSHSHPQIYVIKELIRQWKKENKVVMYIDIHGHSRKKNVFFYGCCNKQSNNLKPKQFPFLMDKIYDAFKYSHCSFNVSKDKEGTARVTLWKELQIDYVYTLQASFCGSSFGLNYLQTDYQKIGKKLCEGMSVFLYDREQSPSNTMQKMIELKEKAFNQLKENDLAYNFEDQNGSESEPQKGQIQQKDRNVQTGLPKPDALIKKVYNKDKQKKAISTTNFFPRSFRSDKNKSILSQRTIIPKLSQMLHQKDHLQIQISPPFHEKQTKPFKFTKYSEIQEQNPLFNKHSQAFRNTGLYSRNIRVYSLNKNQQKYTQKPQQFVQQSQQAKNSLKVSLMQGREGVQYRRVRKLVEQNSNRQKLATEEQSNYVVKQLQGNQLKVDKFERIGRKYAVTPRFYPVTHQKNRRTSADIYLRRHQQYPNQMSINPAEATINCKGIEIISKR